ncbi:MAG: polyprenol monophosphomannose synthase [bacterium]
MKYISLVIPTFNEAKNLPLFFDEIEGIIDKSSFDLEYIVVDDNSPDGTGQVADNLKSQYPIKVIHRAGKLGLGSAVIEGFKMSDREIVGVMDADLSHDPIIINSLLNALGEYDIAIGSRFMDSSVVESWVWWRRLISVVGVFLIKKISRAEDPLSGYFFIKKSVLSGVVLDTKGYKILFEILVKGKWNKIKEIPFIFRMRKFSTSKLNYNEYWLFAKQVIGYSFYAFFRK